MSRGYHSSDVNEVKIESALTGAIFSLPDISKHDIHLLLFQYHLLTPFSVLRACSVNFHITSNTALAKANSTSGLSSKGMVVNQVSEGWIFGIRSRWFLADSTLFWGNVSTFILPSSTISSGGRPQVVYANNPQQARREY